MIDRRAVAGTCSSQSRRSELADERLNQSASAQADTNVLYLSLVVLATWQPLTSMRTQLILLSCIAVRDSLRQWLPPG